MREGGGVKVNLEKVYIFLGGGPFPNVKHISHQSLHLTIKLISVPQNYRSTGLELWTVALLNHCTAAGAPGLLMNSDSKAREKGSWECIIKYKTSSAFYGPIRGLLTVVDWNICHKATTVSRTHWTIEY